jgi:hypothetical protein
MTIREGTMIRKYFLIIILFLATTVLYAAEYSATAYMLDGRIHKCKFMEMTEFSIHLRIDGLPRKFSYNEVGLITFDNSTTNFFEDSETLDDRSDHSVIFKDGLMVSGTILNMIPRSKCTIKSNNGIARFPARDVARIYINPEELFKKYSATSEQKLVFRQ